MKLLQMQLRSRAITVFNKMNDRSCYSLPSDNAVHIKQNPKYTYRKDSSDELEITIEDLEASLNLNKQLLREILFSKVSESDDSEATCNSSSKSIDWILQDNQALEDSLKKLMAERNEAQGKALIAEQIADETQRKEQEITKEYEEKVCEIKYQIERKERVIEEMTAFNKRLEIEAKLFRRSKNMIVVPPSQNLLEKHCAVEELRDYLQKIGRDLHCTMLYRGNLVSNCKMLWEECLRLRFTLDNTEIGVSSEEIEKLTEKIDQMDIEDLGESVEEVGSMISPMPFRVKSEPSSESSEEEGPKSERSYSRIKPQPCIGGKVREMQKHIDQIRNDINSHTENLHRISKSNSELLEENERIAKEYESTQRNIKHLRQVAEKLELQQKSKHAPRKTTEINPEASTDSIVFRIPAEDSERSEIAVRTESFYGT